MDVSRGDANSIGEGVRAGVLRFAHVGSIESSDLSLETTTQGVVTARAGRLALRDVKAQGPTGTLEIGGVVLSGLAAHLQKPLSGAPPRVMYASVQEMQLEAMNALIDGLPRRQPTLSGALRVEPLDALDGVVHAFITDAFWFVDADIVVPFTRGVVDFNRVTVEHIGPNSKLAITSKALHVQGPRGRRVELLAFDGLQLKESASSATISAARARDCGRLALRTLVEAVLRAPADRPIAHFPDVAVGRAMQRTRLSGELQLGDGTLGDATRYIVLGGREQGKNRVAVTSAGLGQRLVLRMAELSADAAALTLAGVLLKTAALSAALEVHVLGSEERRAKPGSYPTIALVVQRATMRDIKLASIAEEARSI